MAELSNISKPSANMNILKESDAQLLDLSVQQAKQQDSKPLHNAQLIFQHLNTQLEALHSSKEKNDPRHVRPTSHLIFLLLP